MRILDGPASPTCPRPRVRASVGPGDPSPVCGTRGGRLAAVKGRRKSKCDRPDPLSLDVGRVEGQVVLIDEDGDEVDIAQP
ncbi:MAG: hypothetical protein KC583_03325, partial [Myxococcales bacterium]|nr:hypothetical protein [Myxococcales bacterium]